MAVKLLISIALGLSLAQMSMADSVQNEAGTELYKKHCAKCHGVEGKANTFRGWMSRAQKFTNSGWQEHTTDEEILDAIANGPGFMPSYKKKLSSEEIHSLLAVIRTF